MAWFMIRAAIVRSPKCPGSRSMYGADVVIVGSRPAHQ
jgi:hypothetical protein